MKPLLRINQNFDVNFDSKIILNWPSLSSHILILFFLMKSSEINLEREFRFSRPVERVPVHELERKSCKGRVAGCSVVWV